MELNAVKWAAVRLGKTIKLVLPAEWFEDPTDTPALCDFWRLYRRDLPSGQEVDSMP
jgi:hypothetical protein